MTTPRSAQGKKRKAKREEEASKKARMDRLKARLRSGMGFPTVSKTKLQKPPGY